MLDKVLNKFLQDKEKDSADAKKGKEKVSGGIAKVLPQLIEMDVESLAHVFEMANKIAVKEKRFNGSFDDILEAIDAKMNDDNDATKIFTEVFEAIDNSAFSRNELTKFVENMSLVKELRTDELDEQKAELMIKRLNTGYQKITGNTLIETTVD